MEAVIAAVRSLLDSGAINRRETVMPACFTRPIWGGDEQSFQVDRRESAAASAVLSKEPWQGDTAGARRFSFSPPHLSQWSCFGFENQ
jgi:hypothetical protein